MHGGAGPTTARRWDERKWPDGISTAPEENHQGTAPPGASSKESRRGLLGRALAADYPPVPCNRPARHMWGPGGAAIPDQLRGDPGEWMIIDLPADIARQLGTNRVDLTEPAARRRALPHLLETGPADLIAATFTLLQLRNEWPHLELSDILRDAWEEAYPALTDDLEIVQPFRVTGTHDDICQMAGTR